MKLNHAAALALVGWYLLAPPPLEQPQKGWAVDTDAPFESWVQTESYDSADECEQQRLKGVQENAKRVAARADFGTNDATVQAPLFARCVSTDDPRLVE